jgi:biopolymer transport protein ExbD
MNFRVRKKNSDSGRIDIVPFVDTLLYLIIFFSLTLNFVQTQGLKLKLPQSSGKEAAAEKNELRITLAKTIEKDGYIYSNFSVEGRIFSLGEIERLVNQRTLTGKDLVVIIQADERVSQGEVVKVMDIAKSAGIEKIAIATRPKEK